MDTLPSIFPPRLDCCDRDSLSKYWENSWQLEEILLKSLVDDEVFGLKPDLLRNPLVFYLGHSAVFYLNKLIQVGLIEKRINPEYEILFEIGVDPQTPEELEAELQGIEFPSVAKVWEYRAQAYDTIQKVIQKTPINLPINPHNPLWALFMSIEHSRIHFETSSVLLRQLPPDKLQAFPGWTYAPSSGTVPRNEMILVREGKVKLGKPENSPLYGWDSEYGELKVEVKPFLVSKYLITNGEFKEFVDDGGYDNQEFWTEKSWFWKKEHKIKHPLFWIPMGDGNYKYRTLFEEIDLPLDYPVEVNHYEAIAYCRWRGDGYRLMTEAEWNLALQEAKEHNSIPPTDPLLTENYNLNLKFGSPTPVGSLETAQSELGLYDLRGNVWEWLSDDFYSLPGFKPHPLYEDQAAPFFDEQHKMMVGGSWATNGTMASKSYRNWFRPFFYQHSGFRIVKN
jgi:5-histidylcysteine sulfoxide synthase